jgi:aminoglycoside phosphotransferase (APT) family kinase protein
MEPSRRGANMFVASRLGPAAFVKCIWHEHMADMLIREHRHVRLLQQILTAGLERSVPAVCELVVDDGDRFLVFEHMAGDRISEYVDGTRPRHARRVEASMRAAIEWLVRFQQQTTGAVAPLASFGEGFDAASAAYLRAGHQPTPVRAWLEEMSTVIAGGAGVNVRLVCCHGDFYPGNVLLDGDRVRVIDWETMRVDAAQTDDLFSYFMSYRLPASRSPGKDHVLDSFRFVFLDDNWLSRMVRRVIAHYASQTGMVEGRPLEALFASYLLRQATLEAGGAMEHKMMAREGWQARLAYYADHRRTSVLRAG